MNYLLLEDEIFTEIKLRYTDSYEPELCTSAARGTSRQGREEFSSLPLGISDRELGRGPLPPLTLVSVEKLVNEAISVYRARFPRMKKTFNKTDDIYCSISRELFSQDISSCADIMKKLCGKDAFAELSIGEKFAELSVTAEKEESFSSLDASEIPALARSSGLGYEIRMFESKNFVKAVIVFQKSRNGIMNRLYNGG